MNHKQGWASGAMRRNAFAFLTRQERRKYEIARELGLLDRVKAVGWAGLSAKETGRIGGLMGRENRVLPAVPEPHTVSEPLAEPETHTVSEPPAGPSPQATKEGE